MMRDIIKDSTNQSTRIRFLDNSGNPATGVTAATPGLTIWYVRGTGTPTSVGTINNLGAADAAHNDAGIYHLGGGYYRVDLPDAAVADGADDVAVIAVATSLVAIGAIHPLVAAASAGAGSGARTVTVTVTDGTDPLQNALVRFTLGAETYTSTTDVNGQAVFNLDDGTWTVSITLTGYSYAGTTLVVDGTEAPTYAMTAVTITPSTAGKTTGFLTTYDENGDVEAGVEIHCTFVQTSSGSVGAGFDNTQRTETSDVNGLVQFTGLFKGQTYRFTRGTYTKPFDVTIPAGVGDVYELPSIIGAT